MKASFFVIFVVIFVAISHLPTNGKSSMYLHGQAVENKHQVTSKLFCENCKKTM